MKKQLGFLFLFLVAFIVFGSCNNATQDGAQKKPDTVRVQRDSVEVKDTTNKH